MPRLEYGTGFSLNGGGGGGSSFWDDLARQGISILDDLIRSKLIPGETSTTPTTLTDTPAAECPPGTFEVLGRCVDLIPGGQTSGGGMVLTYGEAVMGRYGAGLVPAKQSQDRLRCPKGSTLGKDNLCYDHLRQSERKWPPGRKPLLTGGDLNAISRSARVANRLKRKNAELRSLGLLPKPKTRRQIELEILAKRGRRHGHDGSSVQVIDTD